MRNLYPALKFSFYLIIFNCFIISSSFSQELGSAFGKPKKSDITLTQYDPEPEAEALVLLKTKSISYKYDFQISQTINHFQRIKIFKESAYEYGEVLIEYYHSSGFESIEKLNAMITYSDGSRRILDEDHITHKELDDEWAQVLLKFPNMQPGSIIEYEYTLKKNYFSAPDDFVFQSEIPLQYAFLSYDIPASIKYNFLTQGNKYIEAEGNAFAMANVPSIHEDVFITTMDDYVGKIETRVQSYYETDYASLEVNPTAEIMIKRLLRDRLFGAQYSKSIYNSKVVSDAKEVLEEEIPLLNKIDKLQDLLLQKVVWDGSMEVKCRKSINKLYREGRAGSTELNFMLLAILREIDVRAYPLLISTRGNGNAYSPFPILADFSYAAIAVEIEGAFFIFDVSDKFKPPSLLNYSALNKYGLVVRKEGFSWVALNTDMSTDIFLGKFTIDENELRGKFSTKHTNYSAYYERDYTRDDDFLDHWKLAFQKKFPRTYIYDGSHENLENINDEFRQDFSIDIPSAVNFKEDTITVTPYLYGMYDVSPFQLTKRGYEVDFAYPFSEQYIFRLDIPDGYTVSKMPTKVTKSKCNGTASLLIDPSTINNQIQIIKKLHVKKVIYSQEEASEIMELFQQIEDETQAKIVLVKTMKG